MRAAVSSILSDMTEPSPLSFPDYDQLASDHRRLLLLVRPLGDAIEPKVFNRLFEAATKKTHFPIEDEALTQVPLRPIEVRFLKTYPTENNEWNDFQAHRGVLGVIAAGVARNPEEREELVRLHEGIKTQYSKTLIASRLICLHDEPVVTHNGGKKSPSPKRETEESKTSNAPHDHLDFPNNFSEKKVELHIQNLIHRIFWSLEKRRVQVHHQDHTGKIHLLCAPFERRDFVGLDMDSRVNKRRMNGRFKKHVGDLSLLCGMLKESQEFYSIAVEVLKGCSDWLWMANSLEGLCAVSVVVNYPHTQRPRSLRRNSFQSTSNPAITVRSNNNSKSSSLGDGRQLRNHLALTAKDLLEAYREIVVHYSKYRHAGVIETEASIKAVQVLTHQKCFLFAAEFLQNIVFINLQMNDDEKVHRFSALSKLYDQINFKRKSAFFNRVAAMRCVAPQNPRPDWRQCYHLLFQTLRGYTIDFSTMSCMLPSRLAPCKGWSDLQVQILQELVGTARRMGDPVAATRHMAFIIQRFSRHITQEEMADLCHQLSVLTAKSPGAAVSHSVEAGIILPPVNIYTIPVVQSFKAAPQPDSLIPHAPAMTPAEAKGPFIFTNIQSLNTKVTKLHTVVGEIFDADLEVLNPLKIPIDVSAMTLLHEGVDFEAFESNFTLPECPNDRAPIKIKLSGIPRSEGELKILGYSVIICGVKSSCVWKVNGQAEPFEVVVCPPVPRLDITVQGKEEREAEEVKLELYNGESTKVQLLVQNNGSMPVGDMEVRHSVTPAKFSNCVTKCDCRLSLDPGDTAEPVFRIEARGAPTATSFILSITVKYSSDSNAHHRLKTVKVSVKLLPSVNIAWWDILPGESAIESYVVLDLRNDSPEEADVSSGQRKRIAIDSESTCRIPLPVPKVHFEEAKAKSRKEFFENYLRQHLDLFWTMTASEKSGFVATSVIDLTPEMLTRLELSPLSWEVSLGGQLWEGGDVSFPSGDPLPIKIAVTNKGSSKVSCKFVLSCYYVSETDAASMEPIAVSGKAYTASCSAGASTDFRFMVIPCAPGRAVLKCQCVLQSEELASNELSLPNIHIALT